MSSIHEWPLVFDEDLDGRGSPFFGLAGDMGFLEHDDVEPAELAPETWSAASVPNGLDIEAQFWTTVRLFDFRCDCEEANNDGRTGQGDRVLAKWFAERDAWCLKRAADLGAFLFQTVPASEGGRL